MLHDNMADNISFSSEDSYGRWSLISFIYFYQFSYLVPDKDFNINHIFHSTQQYTQKEWHLGQSSPNHFIWMNDKAGRSIE